MKVIDCSVRLTPVQLTALRGEGVVAVIRYISPRRKNPKNITASEARQILDTGLQLGLVYESSTDRASKGRETGRTDGADATAWYADLGVPQDVPCFFAVDYDSPSWSTVAPYFGGVVDRFKSHPTGIYGEADVVDGAHQAGILWHWQTVAWSRHRVSPHAHLLQEVGHPGLRTKGAYDENDYLQPVPFWGSAHALIHVPHVLPEEPPMNLGKLNAPVVAEVNRPGGGGWWICADGGTFEFGGAPFIGSAADVHLARPIVDAAVTPTGAGLWLVASDGGVFTYGDAKFHGAASTSPLNAPMCGISAGPDGYVLTAMNGDVFAFGPQPGDLPEPLQKLLA